MWSSNSNRCVCFVCAHLCLSLSALIKKQPDAKKVKQVLSLQSCAQLFHSPNEVITPENNLPQFCSFQIHHSPSPNSSILFNKYINYPSLFLWLKSSAPVYHPAIYAFEQALLVCTITMFLFYLYKVSDELWDDSAVMQMLACWTQRSVMNCGMFLQPCQCLLSELEGWWWIVGGWFCSYANAWLLNSPLSGWIVGWRFCSPANACLLNSILVVEWAVVSLMSFNSSTTCVILGRNLASFFRHRSSKHNRFCCAPLSKGVAVALNRESMIGHTVLLLSSRRRNGFAHFTKVFSSWRKAASLLCLPVNSSSNTTPKLHTLHLAYARLIFIVYNNIKRRYKMRFIYNGGGHFPKPANLF